MGRLPSVAEVDAVMAGQRAGAGVLAVHLQDEESGAAHRSAAALRRLRRQLVAAARADAAPLAAPLGLVRGRVWVLCGRFLRSCATSTTCSSRRAARRATRTCSTSRSMSQTWLAGGRCWP